MSEEIPVDAKSSFDQLLQLGIITRVNKKMFNISNEYRDKSNNLLTELVLDGTYSESVIEKYANMTEACLAILPEIDMRLIGDMMGRTSNDKEIATMVCILDEIRKNHVKIMEKT